MCGNCSDEFYKEHMERFKEMPLERVLNEYDAICSALDLDNAHELMCLDDLISWEWIIRDYCLELVRKYQTVIVGLMGMSERVGDV